MDFQLNLYPVVFSLVLARTSAVILTMPFLGLIKNSAVARSSLSLVIALVVTPVIPTEWANAAREISTLPELLLALTSEMLLGAGIGLVCEIFVTTLMVAGTIISRGTSLRMARSIDPSSGISTSIISTLMRVIFILIVLLNNGHLMIINLMASSFEASFQPMAWMNNDFFTALISAGSLMFKWGLALAFPIMCCSFIIHICMAMLSKLAPDFNVLFLSLPIRLATGLSAFGLTIRFSAGLLERLGDTMLTYCSRVFVG